MHNFNFYRDLFTEALTQEVEKLEKRDTENLYVPVIYTLGIGGKRLRPALLLMGYSIYSNDYKKALPAAIAIEMFHNFTLLHDDIMDNADFRRNQPTVHVKYSDNTAILSGDAMSILSYEYLTQIDTPNYREIINLYTETALQICEGQQYDMDFEQQQDVSEAQYLEMIGLKTAVLLASSLKIGALIGNAPSNESQLLYDFGYNIGMAFQLQDDMLDTFGDYESFGKAIGGDIMANKKTYLAIKAFELANPTLLKELKTWFSTTNAVRDEKVAAVKAIYNALDIKAVTENKIEEFYKKAVDCLNCINLSSDKKEMLLDLSKKMMKRDS